MLHLIFEVCPTVTHCLKYQFVKLLVGLIFPKHSVMLVKRRTDSSSGLGCSRSTFHLTAGPVVAERGKEINSTRNDMVDNKN